MQKGQKSILFVCLGNTCRSPMAEALLKSKLAAKGNSSWTVSSAGTADYHVGKNPNPIAMKVLTEHGIIDFQHKARQITLEDFSIFDYIICMDKWNLRDLNKIKPNDAKRIYRLGEFVINGEIEDVYDPYFDGRDDVFRSVFQHINDCCEGLAEYLLQEAVIGENCLHAK